ncbi:hypothetical protein [Snodgrassella communis]|uniref:hypothetical protein n=1 Tax=Snodgrassella communis TaxID=2946699 RepID=UPI00286A4C36|nr:hypothetical protein [Snodgrassella communis]WMY91914.1 hypothetical protein PYG29_00560 [Snodgrassella communis]
MKKNALLATWVAFFIAGCDYAEERKNRVAERAGKDIMETQVVLDDGRKITCLVYNDHRHAGGLSCDWYNAPPIQPPYPTPSEFTNNRQLKS